MRIGDNFVSRLLNILTQFPIHGKRVIDCRRNRLCTDTSGFTRTECLCNLATVLQICESVHKQVAVDSELLPEAALEALFVQDFWLATMHWPLRQSN